MIYIPSGTYLIGTDKKIGFETDYETPRTEVTINGFYIDETTVTNQEFMEFVTATNYQTDAEKIGWSYVFHYFLDEPKKYPLKVPQTSWWHLVEGANWKHPEGPESDILSRLDHPVVHVSRNDAVAYCQWAGKRLPTEAEWEIAAQGGTNREEYYWGDELARDGVHRCNTWQGEFPNTNTLDDGYAGTAPVKTYDPNPYGLYQMIGNVWEWCVNPGKIELKSFQLVSGKDFWKVHQVPDDELYAIKGGSFLCHYSYCNRYRMCARNSNMSMSTSQNLSFRCVKDVNER